MVGACGRHGRIRFGSCAQRIPTVLDTAAGDGDQEVAMIARNGQLKASLRQVGRQEWEVLCRGFADYSYRQSWAYASQLAQLRGARAEFVAVEKDGAVIALASVRVKTMPVIGSGLAFISGGPM